MRKAYFLFICLVTFSFNALSISIKKIEPVYFPTSVYPGSTFKLKLKVTSTFDKVYYSDIDNKVNFNKFNIKVVSGGSLKKVDKGFVLISVDNTVKNDFIELDVFSQFYIIDSYRLKIPIIIPKKENKIKSLKCKVLSYDVNKVKLNVLAKFYTNETIKVKNRGVLKYNDFNVYVNDKECFFNEAGEILMPDFNACDSLISVRVELKKNPTINTHVDLELNHKINMYKFDNDILSKYIENYDRIDDIFLSIDVLPLSCKSDSILQLKFLNEDRTVYKVIFLPLKDGVVILNVNGKNGRNGKDGQNGRYKSAHGKDGESGEDGKDGKNVIVFYNKKSEKYLSRIIVSNQGGKGGKGGKYGIGKSYYYYIKNRDDSRLIYAPNGRKGHDGFPGKDGVVKLVLVE